MEISVNESDERLARLDWAGRAGRALSHPGSGVPPSMCLSHRRFPSAAPTNIRAYDIMAKAVDFVAGI
ncbi:MAG: hypothetical protein ACLSB9_22915 [Hydrogeniiclostridium mannosilyticum]